MRLFELPTLPKRAGKAVLLFEGSGQPVRNGKEIVLPTHPEGEWFPLKDGTQFLFRPVGYSTVWFGGTDENPFLVILRTEPFTTFARQGEEGFYKYLAPSSPLPDAQLATRQGDIFAFRLPWTWKDLAARTCICGHKIEPIKENGVTVFGTRHVLEGLRGQTPGQSFIGSGRLVAPDHSPVDLGDTPHVFAQTRGLYNPQQAD